MPALDRIPGMPTRVRRALEGIGIDFIPYIGAIKSADIGAFNFTTTGLGTFGNLDVDTLNFNGNIISDSTGTISFDNENLTTTGNITGTIIFVNSIYSYLQEVSDKLTIKSKSDLILDPYSNIVDLLDSRLTTTGVLDGDGLTIGATGGGTITDIKDEDNMASDSQTVLATQQSIKAYVDNILSTGYVPYTGANANVDLGAYNFTTTGLGTFGTVNLTNNTALLQSDGTTLLADDGVGNLFLGEDAFNNDSGEHNVGIGYWAGFYNNTEGNVLYGDENVYVGHEAGRGAAGGNKNQGYQNVGVGYQTFFNNTTGKRNMAFGSAALLKNTTGSRNVAVGVNALRNNTTGSFNIGIGEASRYNSGSGESNVGIGMSSNYYNVSGHFNVIIGYYAGFGVSGESHSNNTFIGTNSGYGITTGGGNVFIGKDSGYRQTANSDRLIIDNQDRGSIANEESNSLIYGIFDADPANQDLYLNADVYLKADGRKLFFGAGDDVSFSFDGAALELNLTETGVNALHIGDGGTTDYTEIKADGEINLHGTARVTNALWIGAEGVRAPPITKPATYVEHGIAGAWEFSDATDDTIIATMRIPNRMDRGVAPSITLGWSSTTQSAFCEWQIEYLWRSADEDTTAGADDTLLSSTDADASVSSATAEGLVLSTFPLVAPSATDACLHLRIKRRADLVADTINGDTVELLGICLSFTSDKLGLAT